MKKNSLPFVIFSMLFLLVGLAFLYAFFSEFIGWINANSWSLESGCINEAELDCRSMSSRSRGIRGSRGSSNSYSPKVSYSFEVDGKKYHGDRIIFGNYYTKKEQALERLANYPKGKLISVYYDPSNPSDCTLDRGMKGIIYVYLVGGLFATTFGAYICYKGFAPPIRETVIK